MPDPNVMQVSDSEGKPLFTITAPEGSYEVRALNRGEQTVVSGPAVVIAQDRRI